MYIVYCRELLCLTTILQRQGSTSPTPPRQATLIHSHSFHSTHSTPQLIVKVDTEVRRKSHLSAARLHPHPHPQPHHTPRHFDFYLLFWFNFVCFLCVCCLDKKIY